MQDESIVYKKNFFNEKLIDDLETYLIESQWTWGHKSNSNPFKPSIPHWSIIFAGVRSKHEKYYDCQNELNGIIASIWSTLQPVFFNDDILVRCYANAISPGSDQRIHYDDDLDGSKTLIVYANKLWNLDWGGDTIVWDKENHIITHSFLPNYNSVLLIPGNSWHGVRPVSVSYCDTLRITLMFKTRPKSSFY